ncbi:MAG: S-layer homology domain-containing protein, partial [Clostridia bacterium]|nr:S-layer homology domain-containing protein [Clostridia bacterium]
TYDSSTQTARVQVTIGANDQKPTLWGGKVLGAGTYILYYDNDQAMKYKLNLVQKYDILGAGSWSLGQESLKTWDYFGRWLTGKYFTDILGNFAQDDILTVAQKGWMIGVSAATFEPRKSLTRAEAAVIMTRVLGLQNDTPTDPFSDTVNHWARDAIGIARKYQIMLGDGDNRFYPDTPLTREQMAIVLDRILVLNNPVTGNPFSDVNPVSNPYSYDAILRLAANGIVNGRGQGAFVPLGIVKRAEMAALINRASAMEMTYPAKSDPSVTSPPIIVEPH